jgi:hypothetical protein
MSGLMLSLDVLGNTFNNVVLRMCHQDSYIHSVSVWLALRSPGDRSFSDMKITGIFSQPISEEILGIYYGMYNTSISSTVILIWGWVGRYWLWTLKNYLTRSIAEYVVI